MLAKVDARSRPEDQLVEKRDEPNGLEEPRKLLVRCGMDPARRRDKVAGLLPGPALVVLGTVSIPDKPGGRKGLPDGVGPLDVFDSRVCG